MKKDKMISCWALGCTNRADKNSNTIKLVTRMKTEHFVQAFSGIFRDIQHLFRHINPNLGVLFRGSFWGGGGGGGVKLPPTCLKLVRIMLETWNLVRKNNHICNFRKYIFQYQGPLNFAGVSIFLQKISVLWQK